MRALYAQVGVQAGLLMGNLCVNSCIMRLLTPQFTAQFTRAVRVLISGRYLLVGIPMAADSTITPQLGDG